MFAIVTRFFNFVNSFSKYQKKDLKKIELKTIRTLNNFLAFFKKISGNSKWKSVPFGIPSFIIDKNIKHTKETLYLKEDRLKCKLLFADYESKDSNDFIIFLHGSARDHTEWLDKNGFGTQYNSIFGNRTIPVVAVSFGMSYIIKDGLPFPYDADLEKIFIFKVIPYIREKLNKKGAIHLIGHSIGSFSAFNLAFKYPDTFKTVFAISPFFVSDNPFNEDFVYYKDALKTNPTWSYLVKYNLLYAFKDQDDWRENNPIDLLYKIEKEKAPLIIITESNEELEGFNENILYFIKKLEQLGINYNYYRVNGNHHNSDIKDAYRLFLSKLNA